MDSLPNTCVFICWTGGQVEFLRRKHRDRAVMAWVLAWQASMLCAWHGLPCCAVPCCALVGRQAGVIHSCLHLPAQLSYPCAVAHPPQAADAVDTLVPSCSSVVVPLY
jgi:hypothetical protein